MSRITKVHYGYLIIRFLLFVSIFISHIFGNGWLNGNVKYFCDLVVWLFFIGSMIHRLFPAKHNSMGNQKIFRKNFIPTEVKNIKRDTKSAIIVLVVWILLNLPFCILYLLDYLSADFMMLLALFYSVCDYICILFYCPFQKWMMKNKCCNTCRIYNWDFAMMFTPLIFVPNFYNYVLVCLSFIVLIIWEINYYLHTERFHEETNENLKCKNCKEFMCKNKLRVIRK